MNVDLDCMEASRTLSEAQDANLPVGERTRLRLHLVICITCRNIESQFDFLRCAMRQL